MTEFNPTNAPADAPPSEAAPAGHTYDGIEEYDNPMPGWWQWTFWGTIWFSILYVPINYSTHVDGSVLASYERAKQADLLLQFAEIGELEPNGESVVRFLNQPRWLDVGRSVYSQNCVSCHGPDGLGLIGPNLRDGHYKHVTKIDDVLAVIQNGAMNGSMPSWQTRLSVNEQILVSSYVASLRGTADGAGKIAEGKEIAAWPEPPPVEEKAAKGGAAEDKAGESTAPDTPTETL